MRRMIRAALLTSMAVLLAGHTPARADDWQVETTDGVRTAIVMPAPPVTRADGHRAARGHHLGRADRALVRLC